MRFTLASAAAILAFTASASAAPASSGLHKGKRYIQTAEGDFFTTTIAINGLTHYPMLAPKEHAVPVRFTGPNGELQADLPDLNGEYVSGSITLDEESVFQGLQTAYFGDSAATRPTSGFNVVNGTVTVDKEYFSGWYACNAGGNYRQLYWSHFTNQTEDIPTCSRVTLTTFEVL